MKNKFLMFLCILAAVGCTNTKPKQPSEKISALTGKEYIAQYGKTLSLDESLKIAKERNFDLRVKALEREIASLDKKIAFGNFLPSINVMGGYTQLNDGINLDVDVSELSVKALEREIASLDKKIAFGNFLPSINVMGGYTQLNDGINLDVDVSELSSKLNPVLSGMTGMDISLPSTMNSRFVDKSFYTFGVSAQIPVFVPSTWYLYAARQKGEKISELAENLSLSLLQ